MDQHETIAWVESPLQLVGAAEWAAARGRAVPVAGRLTAQMAETADELVARGALFGTLEAYLGIPFALLARHRHWLVGDGFSGQFRLAATLLRPRRITFLDDGANTLPLADALLGRRAYARPGVTERGLTTRLAPFAAMTVLQRARVGAVQVFTAFDLGDERSAALARVGLEVRHHDFAWTRSTARPGRGPRGIVVLGSARPVDGRMSLPAYLEWIAGAVAGRSVVYLPHRREPAEQLAAVARIPGVSIDRPGLPIELVLAGATGIDVRTLPSSTTTTLAAVLGAGSRINGRLVERRAVRA